MRYILINETGNESAVNAIRNSHVSEFRHHIVVNAPGLESQSRGSNERKALIGELCRLRKRWPNAKILGVTEVDTSQSHAPVRVSPLMNALRRVLSNLP